MNFDTRASIYESVSTTDDAGSVSLSYTKVGEVFVADVRISKKLIITAAREASQLEQVFESRWHPALREGVFLRLPDTVPGCYLEVTRADEVSRQKGYTLYTKFTRVSP